MPTNIGHSLALFLILPVASIPGWAAYSYPIDGNVYTSQVSAEQLRVAPAWDASAPNPPLSARKAITIERKFMADKFKPDTEHQDWTPRLESAQLIPVNDNWHWQVGFAWYPKSTGLLGKPPYCEIQLLMDGSVCPMRRAPRKAAFQ